MNLFHILEDVQCITRFRGVFHQVPVYRRGDRLYAKHGSGFIRLEGNGNTTAPSVIYVDLDKHPDISMTGKWKSPLY